MTTPATVAVIGGSITGPTTALLLRQAGYDQVTVYEATLAATAQAGGVIGLDHVSLDTFDRLGIPQDEYIPYASERVVAIQVADRREGGRVRTIYPGRNTTWPLLHTALQSRLPDGTYRAGKRLSKLLPDSNGTVLEFADGDTARAGLVVFADGRRSAGRRILDPGRRLRYAGYVAHRGLSDCGMAGLADFTRFEMPHSQFNLFPICLPAGVGVDWTFYLDERADDFRLHFGADPTARTFVLPHQLPDAVRRRVDTHAYAMLPEREADVVRDTATRMAAPVVDIDPPTTMVHAVGGGRAVLIGDALAPVRPHTARGANAGIEQASGLAVALGQHLRHGADFDGALSGWQDRHLPAVSAAVARGPVLGARLGLGLVSA